MAKRVSTGSGRMKVREREISKKEKSADLLEKTAEGAEGGGGVLPEPRFGPSLAVPLKREDMAERAGGQSVEVWS